MIRKDQLPNIWGDDFAAGTGSVQTVVMPSGKASKYVICPKEDWRMLNLDDCTDSGIQVKEDSYDNMKLLVEEGAEAELYILQIRNNEKVTNLDVKMETGSRLHLCTITLGGRHIRNNVVVRMVGEHCDLEADGLYLVDHEQECDNYIFVEHAQPHCNSRELYKGIVDDAARARFNGHVLVQDYAVKTEAYMTNRNILLSDKSHVDTRPFLEIYNDDVKCSHGSTIGQLDKDALFYLRSRGIPKRTAMMMLSYAFCDEVVRSISMDFLRDTVGDIVKKYLHGELTPPCDECAIRCTTPCNGPDAIFNIDPEKL